MFLDCPPDFQKAVYEWLAAVGEPEKNCFTASPFQIDVQCKDKYAAEKLWRLRHMVPAIKDQQCGLKIRVRGREYASQLSRAFMLESANNSSNIVMIAASTASTANGLVAVYRYSLDQDFVHLKVEPQLNARRLNKINCIGQPLNFLDNDVAIPRRSCLEKALETGKEQVYRYTHFWQNAIWRFRGTAIVLPDGIQLTIEDDDQEHGNWQRGYWINVVN